MIRPGPSDEFPWRRGPEPGEPEARRGARAGPGRRRIAPGRPILRGIVARRAATKHSHRNPGGGARSLRSARNDRKGTDAMSEDWAKLTADLERLLKLRSFVFGMKLFEKAAEMEAIPRIRRPQSIHTLDQIVGQAARLGWTVGVTADNLVGAQCRAVVGLGNAKDEAWRSGKHMVGVWYSTEADARAHQAAMDCVADGKYEALAIAPLASGRLDPPDIALFYATPGAMIYFINGLQWAGYKKFDWGIVGESACADSWGRALKTREPSLSIPCFAERRYGGVLDDEMLMALPPDYLPKAIAGMEALAKNGLRYPFPQYGIQQDVRAGMAVSYPSRAG
jgi:uncharacterized protein (DUF169 family)